MILAIDILYNQSVWIQNDNEDEECNFSHGFHKWAQNKTKNYRKKLWKQWNWKCTESARCKILIKRNSFNSFEWPLPSTSSRDNRWKQRQQSVRTKILIWFFSIGWLESKNDFHKIERKNGKCQKKTRTTTKIIWSIFVFTFSFCIAHSFWRKVNIIYTGCLSSSWIPGIFGSTSCSSIKWKSVHLCLTSSVQKTASSINEEYYRYHIKSIPEYRSVPKE